MHRPAAAPHPTVDLVDLDGAVTTGGRRSGRRRGRRALERRLGGNGRREHHVARGGALPGRIGQLRRDAGPRRVSVCAVQVVAASAGRAAGQHQRSDHTGDVAHEREEVYDAAANQPVGEIARPRRRVRTVRSASRRPRGKVRRSPGATAALRGRRRRRGWHRRPGARPGRRDVGRRRDAPASSTSTVPTPAAASNVVTAAPTRPAPCTDTTADRRRASTATPPSARSRTSDAAARSGASRSRSPWLSVRAPAGQRTRRRARRRARAARAAPRPGPARCRGGGPCRASPPVAGAVERSTRRAQRWSRPLITTAWPGPRRAAAWWRRATPGAAPA